MVIGGGNTAIGDCLYLTKFAKKVYLVHRREQFRATKAEVDKLIETGVEIIYNSVVTQVIGDKKLDAVMLNNVKTGENKLLNVDGVFVAIGQIPTSEVVASEVVRDEYGYILADEDMQTNIAGVFVAGDVRKKKVRQVITACSDGAIASEMASIYIQSVDKKK